jgi:hypothetical protein
MSWQSVGPVLSTFLRSMPSGPALVTEIFDCKSAAAKRDLDPKTVHAAYQAGFGGESQVVNLSRYPSIIFYLIGHFSRVQPYIIDVACHGKLWVQFFQLF